MEKATIGAILKKRIKEKGYTQKDFADITGVKYSTLRKYLSGKAIYSCELLLQFTEILDCSVDYLLGLSESPIREYHEIAEQTKLSETAIGKIVKYAKSYDQNFNAKIHIQCLDWMLCDALLFDYMCLFLVSSKYMNEICEDIIEMIINSMELNDMYEESANMMLETMSMIAVINALKGLKNKVTPDIIKELNELNTKEQYHEAENQMAMAMGNQEEQSDKLLVPPANSIGG